MNKIKDKKKSLYKYISSKEKTGEEGNITDEGQSVWSLFFSSIVPIAVIRWLTVLIPRTKDHSRKRTSQRGIRLAFSSGWASSSDRRGPSRGYLYLVSSDLWGLAGSSWGTRSLEKIRGKEGAIRKVEEAESEDHRAVSLNAVSGKFFTNKQTNFLGGTGRWKC